MAQVGSLVQDRSRATPRLPVFSERALVQAHNRYIHSILKRPGSGWGLAQRPKPRNEICVRLDSHRVIARFPSAGRVATMQTGGVHATFLFASDAESHAQQFAERPLPLHSGTVLRSGQSPAPATFCFSLDS